MGASRESPLSGRRAWVGCAWRSCHPHRQHIAMLALPSVRPHTNTPLPLSLGIVMYTCNPCLLSLSSQGSIQQLTIYTDPRTPEELCEAQESSVSLCLPPTLCTLTPPSARGRLVAQPFSPLSVRQPRSLSSWPALSRVLFWAFGFPSSFTALQPSPWSGGCASYEMILWLWQSMAWFPAFLPRRVSGF